MQFQSIIGQSDIKNKLVELVQQNRLSHALLFLAKEGSGALQLALAFAQYIVCEKNGLPRNQQKVESLFLEKSSRAEKVNISISDSCGQCAACKKAQQLVHPDIHFSYPVIPKKKDTPPLSTDYIADWREFILSSPYGNVYDWLQQIGAENKQGNITATECNDIIRKLSLKSFESEYKILIQWMPEYLGNEGNKLLKLIEEPPPNTLFILVAENDSLILPTILSRCQLIKIPSLDVTTIENALIEKNNIQADRAHQLALMCDGNFRQAEKLLEQTEEDWHTLLCEWLNALLKNGPAAQTKWVEEMSRLGREKQKQFLYYFNHLLGQSIRFRITENPLAEKEKEFVIRLNKLVSVSQQKAIIEELDKAAYYIERNANAKILFHALTIKLNHIIKDNIVFA